jgi:hypothetical protein
VGVLPERYSLPGECSAEVVPVWSQVGRDDVFSNGVTTVLLLSNLFCVVCALMARATLRMSAEASEAIGAFVGPKDGSGFAEKRGED